MSLYRFSWKKSKNSVELNNEALKVVIGRNEFFPLREYTIPAAALKGMIFRQKKIPFNRWDELILWYEKSPGKDRQVFLPADPGNVEIRALADELGRRFPQADLRQLPPREALKRIPVSWWQPQVFIWPVFTLSIVCLFFLPQFIHSFNRGHQTLTAEAVSRGIQPQTNYLTIHGKVLDLGLREKTGTGRRKTYRQYYPLVPFNWKPGEPVFILLETSDYTSQEKGPFLSQTAFRGLWRTVLWEGPSSGQLDYLRKNYGLTFSPAPMLLEVNVDPASEAAFSLIILGLYGLVIVAGFVSVWMLFKR
jgi:hypothetical protein